LTVPVPPACFGAVSVDHSRVLTPAQVRAARGLLGWTQVVLAERAGVSRPTVTHFEQGTRMPIPVVVEAIRTTFEAEGLEFIPEGAASTGQGVGVRLRHASARTEEDGSPAEPTP
jgi:transcriptional regulator with XRE-family HTH domain